MSSVLSLRGLPRDYLEAVGGRLGGLEQILVSALGTPPPEEVLLRIKPVLKVLSLRVVIWLDDLDRFAERMGASTAAIRALLPLFTKVSGLSFVLAVARLGAAPSEADIGKLGLFVERIPQLDPGFVVNVVRLFRKRRLAEKPFIDIDGRSGTELGKMCDDSGTGIWRLFPSSIEHTIADVTRSSKSISPRSITQASRARRSASLSALGVPLAESSDGLVPEWSAATAPGMRERQPYAPFPLNRAGARITLWRKSYTSTAGVAFSTCHHGDTEARRTPEYG